MSNSYTFVIIFFHPVHLELSLKFSRCKDAPFRFLGKLLAKIKLNLSRNNLNSTIQSF